MKNYTDFNRNWSFAILGGFVGAFGGAFIGAGLMADDMSGSAPGVVTWGPIGFVFGGAFGAMTAFALSSVFGNRSEKPKRHDGSSPGPASLDDQEGP